MEGLYFLSLVLQVGLILVALNCLDGTKTKIGGVLFVFWLTLIFSSGVEHSFTYTNSYTTQRTLVSAQPSHTQINGSISGNFLMFSGVIGEDRVYLLREEVEKGLYKDFEVKHEVYIREDESLTTKGRFVQHFKCNNINIEYIWLGMQLFRNIKNKCEYDRQEIVVPVGSVIKELNI
ncbi:putative TMhelix containing protein I [Vibrio phage VPMCC14]|nr:putative TMhelix containing protein I [Vibrio phage VPMCC14]